MAILLSKGSSYTEPPESEEGEDGASVADSVEFSEMFDAFTEALGVKPNDVDAARRRLCALFSIYCSMKGY
jgi:hypothetical protein